MIEELSDFKTINAAFPHIGKKLVQLWGGSGFQPYLDELQHNTRAEQRAGFPSGVLLALSSLADAHDIEFPALVRKGSDLWSLNKNS